MSNRPSQDNWLQILQRAGVLMVTKAGSLLMLRACSVAGMRNTQLLSCITSGAAAHRHHLNDTELAYIIWACAELRYSQRDKLQPLLDEMQLRICKSPVSLRHLAAWLRCTCILKVQHLVCFSFAH